MQEKPKHTIGVIGVRDFNGSIYQNYDHVENILLAHIKRNAIQPVTIVTGGGRGVEVLVVQVAERHKFALRKIPPNIAQYGSQKAFAFRNAAIVADSLELVVFWDGIMSPIPDAITTAMHLSRHVTVYPLN